MTPAELAQLPPLEIPDAVAPDVHALMTAFIAEHWPPADVVERALALTELAQRLTAVPGVRVHWVPWEIVEP